MLERAWRRCPIAKWYVDAMRGYAWRRCTIGKSRVWTPLQNGCGVDAMLEWQLCQRSLCFKILDLAPCMGSFVWKASVHCQRSLLLFYIVNALHCESSLRVVLFPKTDSSTALLPFYIVKALDGSVRKTFGPASILHCECSLRVVLCSKTDVLTALLLPFYIANAVWNNIGPASAAILHCERSLRLAAAATAVAVHL